MLFFFVWVGAKKKGWINQHGAWKCRPNVRARKRKHDPPSATKSGTARRHPFRTPRPNHGTLRMPAAAVLSDRFSEEAELDDAVHTALLTMREGFEGEMTEKNIEVRIWCL